MASILNNAVSDAADYAPSSESTLTPISAGVTAVSPAKAASLMSPNLMGFTSEDDAATSKSNPIRHSAVACPASSSNARSPKLPIASVGRAADVFTPFPQLAQNADDAIKALICRAWDAKNLSGKYLGTEYIISDEHGNVMHCIARSVIAHCVVPKIQVGAIYSIRRFTLEQNKASYRVRRDDPFLIQLEANTVIDKLTCSTLGFIRQPFHLQPIEEIAFNGHKYLIDVVGRVVNLGEWKATSNNSHYLNFHLINERGRSIQVTLWGSLGEELLRRCSGPDALYVIVLPAMKVREYRGAVQIQSTLGTMIFDDQRIPEIAAARELMKEAVPPPDNTGNLRQLLQLGREQKGVNQQSMTLRCCVKIVGIHPQSTWTYNSCAESGCKKGLKPVENQLYCDACAKYCEFPLLRYRLRLQVSDDSTTLVVTLFDEVAEALIQKKSTVIIQEMAGRTEENEYPAEILQLVGNTHVFEFKTHTYYNHGHYESFTVAKVVTGVQVGEIKKKDLPAGAPDNEETNTKVDLNAKPSSVTSVTDQSDDSKQHCKILSEDMPEPEKDVALVVDTPAKTSMKRKFIAVSDDED